MTIKTVSDLQIGIKLAEDVYTPLGGLLMQKGKVLLPRDIEVLKAFMVEQVTVESVEGDSTRVPTVKSAGQKPSLLFSEQPQASAEEESSARKEQSLHEEYDKMLALIKRCYQSAITGELHMYEVRRQMQQLLEHQKDYYALKFIPRVTNRHDYRYHHAVLCALSSYKLAQWVGLPEKEWMQVAFAGLLHDIGNVRIDPIILNKPSKLTQEEQEEVRRHTTYGYQILKNVAAVNEGVRLAALQHHEKVDGTGYPLKLEGSRIHMYAKIVAVTDVFHAMTLDKFHRNAQSSYAVLEQLHLESFGKLDPMLVQTFIQRLTSFHHGMRVRLSNGSLGEIVFTDSKHPTRPMVSVHGEIVNLAQQRHLFIQEVIY
ncbi:MULTISPECIES: HD-GYP domain-containing protein [Paenibacillus]|uniref:HD domain-containing protein n=1 Tax=Paenibacillus campinasensis TaxID=66347 RepID=A0A268ELP4_9BACL|nr:MULTISPECIES: HD-GYP domain-containing protein [Paenibacillus]MUG68584.1 HD domain-containing protein [Paenibacillus campinasensis]PAD74042.1 HD family phosphohydrolase [Paenibacillus campinasensis]PAK50658.1 HD family phosphohydrolase [Paenibacillus sp. 7541]